MLLEYCWITGLDSPERCAIVSLKMFLQIGLLSLIFTALVSILTEFLQVGLRFTPVLLAPQATRFDLGKGIRKIGSGVRSSWQFGIRLTVFAAALVWSCSDIVAQAVQWQLLPPDAQATQILRLLRRAGAVSVAVFASLAALEYGLKRKTFFKELSMSLDEMRKEHRDDAGDPQIRAVRFALHQSMTFDEMVARTRRANVVVVGALEVSKGRANGISK